MTQGRGSELASDGTNSATGPTGTGRPGFSAGQRDDQEERQEEEGMKSKEHASGGGLWLWGWKGCPSPPADDPGYA